MKELKKLPVLRGLGRIGERKNGRAEEMPVLWRKNKKNNRTYEENGNVCVRQMRCRCLFLWR